MSDLTSLSRTVIYTLGGQELKFRRFTLGMLAGFMQTLRAREIARMREALGPDASAAERVELVRQCSRGSGLQDVEVFGSPEGVQLALYTCAKPEQPDITEEQIGDLVGLEDMPALIVFAQRELLNVPDASEGDQGNA